MIATSPKQHRSKTALALLAVWLACATPGGEGAAEANDLFVNNVAGNDGNDGRQPTPSGANGPCQTISGGLRLARPGDRVIVANTGVPYRESLTVQAIHQGLPRLPFTIEGNGAVLDGSMPVHPAAWEHVKGDVYRFDAPRKSHQQLFLDNRPVARKWLPSSRMAPRPPLAPLEWCLHRGWVYFCCEESRTPADYPLSHTFLPVGITLYEVQNVIVRNLVIQGFQLDGVNAHDSVFGADLMNLTCRGNGRSGISIGGASRVRVTRCLVGNNGAAQLRTAGYSHTYLQTNELLGTESEPAIDQTAGGRVLRIDEAQAAMPTQTR